MCENLEIYIYSEIWFFSFGESLRKIIMIKENKSSRHHCWNVGNCKFQLYLVISSSQIFFKILKMCTSWNFWCFSFGQSVKKRRRFIYIYWKHDCSWNFWCFSFGQSVKKRRRFIYIYWKHDCWNVLNWMIQMHF
jgi:hypothetical protein